VHYILLFFICVLPVTVCECHIEIKGYLLYLLTSSLNLNAMFVSGPDHASLFREHLCEDTHDRGDVCTSHKTTVESSHLVRTNLTKASVPARDWCETLTWCHEANCKAVGFGDFCICHLAGPGAAHVVTEDAVDWLSYVIVVVVGVAFVNCIYI